MTRQTRGKLVALLVLLTALFPTLGAGGWYCEGERCGTTWGACCCAAPARADAYCANTEPGATASACGSGCNCVMVVAADSGSQAPPATAVSVAFLPVAVLPVSLPVYSAPRVQKPVLFGMETRGPPVVSVTLSSPSLRAPPPDVPHVI